MKASTWVSTVQKGYFLWLTKHATPPPPTVDIWNKYGKQEKHFPNIIIILPGKGLLTKEEC
jgi:hypothetical protein